MTHRAACPNGGLIDDYRIIIKSHEKIMVEDISAALKESPKEIHQEDLATLMRSKLGAEVKITGWHHGIKITTIRK